MPATKPISTRVPMDEYVKIQKEAIRLKMSISDYLIMKLYEPKIDLGEIKVKKEKVAKSMAIKEMKELVLKLCEDVIQNEEYTKEEVIKKIENLYVDMSSK